MKTKNIPTKIIIILIISFFTFFPSKFYAQNIKYAKQLIDTLASPYLCGRYYIKNNNIKAAKIIATELKNHKITSFANSYFQYFTLDANVFEKTPSVKINNKIYTPGKAFVLAGYSGPKNGTFKVLALKKTFLKNDKRFFKFLNKNLKNTFLYISDKLYENKNYKDKIQILLYKNPVNAEGYIVETGSLVFVPSTQKKDFDVIYILSDSLKGKPKNITLDIESNLQKDFKTQNIVGYLKGETDSFIVLTAHYDHIGCLGKSAVFTGAHDNASGVAMVLDLAREFSNRKCSPHYSIAFMFFSGEELGLIGSHFYVENPLFPLSKIKLLINFDMLGSGDEGIMIFGGKEKPNLMKILDSINTKNNFVKKIVLRKMRPNSDQYFFAEAGVPAIYVLTLGNYKEYHNVYDTRENIPLSNYENVARLMRSFIDNINKRTKQIKKNKK